MRANYKPMDIKMLRYSLVTKPSEFVHLVREWTEAVILYWCIYKGVHRMNLQQLCWTCLLALILPIVALASTPAQEAAEREQAYAWQNAVFEQLESIGTADSPTAAAMLLPVQTSAADPDDQAAIVEDYMAAMHQSAGNRLQLLDRAAALEPDAADIASLALGLCMQVAGCDMDARAQNLHLAAPDDASYLMPALTKANKEKKTDQISDILQSMAEASNFNSYNAGIRHRLQRSTKQSSNWPELPTLAKDSGYNFDKKSMIIANGTAYMYSVTVPSFGAILNACKETNTHFTDREACRHIGLALIRDNSALYASMGRVLWRRTARDDADLAAAKQASHIADWQRETYTQALMDGTIESPESLQAMLDNGGEIPGMLALLKQHDLPALPAEGWVSRHERLERNKTVVPAPSSSACSGTP